MRKGSVDESGLNKMPTTTKCHDCGSKANFAVSKTDHSDLLHIICEWQDIHTMESGVVCTIRDCESEKYQGPRKVGDKSRLCKTETIYQICKKRRQQHGGKTLEVERPEANIAQTILRVC